MSANLWAGLGLALLAGMMAGNCMLPAKFARRWAWENIWLVFTVFSLIVFPWTLAFARVERLGEIYAGLPLSAFALPLLFGFGWGIAQVLFGLSVARLGLALGYAVIIGLGSLLGTLVPLIFQRREVVGTSQGAVIFIGLAVMVAGIAISGKAGRLREAGQGAAGDAYGPALVLAIVCGVMAPMLNYSFAFGDAIAREAIRLGTPATDASYAVWPAGLTGGLIPNLAYSLWLLWRHKTWNRFALAGRDFLLPVAMAVFWMGAMAIYGVSAVYLGSLGTSVGWALFQIFMIMTANIGGVATGEWRKAAPRARQLLWLGLGLLAAATVVISFGNQG
jgi:L-rhamnose-H+ transport protein